MRGRPKGSKNKPKEIKEQSQEINRIKKEIADLRAKKLRLPSGSKERIEIHRKIKDMQTLLTEKKEVKAETQEIQNEKTPIIQEIYKYDKLANKIGQNLYKFSVEQLNKHLKKLKGEE